MVMVDMISNNVANLRIKRVGVSKYRAATNAGIPQSHWQKIEDGVVAMPRLDTARRVAKALDATLDEVWPVEDE